MAIDAPVQKRYVASDRQTIDAFIDELSDYSYVLGLGMYSGKDAEKLRIETSCNGRFRNNGSRLNRRSISRQLRPNDLCKNAQGIGNSWCNYISFAVASKLGESRYGFVHIPKSFNVKVAANEVQNQLAFILKNDKEQVV